MKKIRVTKEESEDLEAGACIACGELNFCVGPEARRVECAACGKMKVYNMEDLGYMDLLIIEGSPAPMSVSEFSRLGGQAKTEAKARSARENGKKGGRPKKT